ncbi:hypothetical protein JQ628_22395 [Bradyrhizobium lablabi]|uniref:hypothetical protein n=1 Tax=Bradyrhizobium lablabi TaxID=722472 RepID=UPI001BA7AB17|nr:hypothetical protein [Bradyrhizobium lablabi]MBR1124295.1 hypothetical protein [Bradyrhizobium lablabi]
MADMMSILSASYKSAGLNVPSHTPYVAVDPALYEGSWTGKYPDGKTFEIGVSNVNGFRAKVAYKSGTTVKYQDVLIKDNAFRVGDTKFTLTGYGQALVKNVVTDPASGSTFLDQAYAKRTK